MPARGDTRFQPVATVHAYLVVCAVRLPPYIYPEIQKLYNMDTMVQSFHIRLRWQYVTEMIMKISPIDGVLGVLYRPSSQDTELLEIGITVEKGADHFQTGLQVGLIAMEYIAKEKFGIELTRTEGAPGDIGGRI